MQSVILILYLFIFIGIGIVNYRQASLTARKLVEQYEKD